MTKQIKNEARFFLYRLYSSPILKLLASSAHTFNSIHQIVTHILAHKPKTHGIYQNRFEKIAHITSSIT